MERAPSSADRNRKGCTCQGGEWGLVWGGGLHGLGSEKSSSCRTGVLLAVGQMWESHRLAVHGGSSEGRL